MKHFHAVTRSKLWFALALTLAPLLAGCGSDLAGSREIEIVRITPNAPGLIYTSGLTSPLRAVINDQAALEQMWTTAFAAVGSPPQIPTIDFTKEMVVVVALGQRASGGYSIQVADAKMSRGALVIDVLLKSPGNRCAVTLSFTEPLDIVKIARVSGSVRFEDRSRVQSCGS
ncbi:MAG: protease complex subunit PrcB family protein [Candidatus Eisenbacteria bacterium]|uniref:Protease complex subunit PrcB family protein n=1 Tax=Eiseniibacteriota bacterium TaxID=2212470 RepID=A0A849SN24_UNCEI|nr:protease complex subunit PrcB family protein [Candidatus Eisenbacteria bacterium]